MYKGLLIIATGLLVQFSLAQDLVLPTDFRQHNLTEYNSNLFSPVFTLDRNNPESLALWTRWQWQNIDTDPSTLFLNYSRMLNQESALGIGFFQHNTGTYLHTGGAANYAYVLQLENQASISFGVNLFAFSRSLADEQFQSDPGIISPPVEEDNNFLIQVAPSLQFAIANFNIGIMGENLFDYNFTTNDRETQPSEKIYLGYAGYLIPLDNGGTTSSKFVRPTVYYKNIPGADDQFGITTLFSTSKFWLQGGYNTFYGISGGLGGRFFKNFSIGALAEFGVDSSLDDRDPSLEIITAYSFGQKDPRKKVVGFEVEDEDEDEIKVEDAIQEAEESKPTEEAIALEEAREQARQDQLELERQMEEDRKIREQQVQDSIMAVRAAEIEAAEREKAAALEPEAEEPSAEQPQEGERFEQSTITKEGVAPGYYLIVNVFGNINYYRQFMKKLQDQGLNPGSFLRPLNNYNYVYLERFDTVDEARRAKRSRYNGKYTDDIWIFAVLPD